MNVQIAYDFDEPIYPWYDLAHERCVRAGIVPEGCVPTTWAPHEAYGVSLETWVGVLNHEVWHGDMYTQPIDHAIADDIDRMYNLGFGIHIITARGQFGEEGERIKELTKESLDQAGIRYDTLNFAKDKVGVAQELGIDWFIDDAPHNYDPLDEAGINVWLLNERWNKPWEDGRRRVSSIFAFNRKIRNHYGFHQVSPV